MPSRSGNRTGSPDIPFHRRFGHLENLDDQSATEAPNASCLEGAPEFPPGLVRARPGTPGVDYHTPDVLVIAGQPDAQLCALRVESQ